MLTGWTLEKRGQCRTQATLGPPVEVFHACVLLMYRISVRYY